MPLFISAADTNARYLSGNFAPVHQVQPLTPCSFAGIIPDDLAGGEYVRNGGNPVNNETLGRDAHWFDGDGMLSGVMFRRATSNRIVPEFVNQYILTDVLLSTLTSPALVTPILPSITTLVNPLSPLLTIIWRILRTVMLVILSHLPGSRAVIRKISVANTAIVYHDGRALATCESGIPMRVALPGLETVGWFDGRSCEGEEVYESAPGFGGSGLLSFMKEWTTAHVKYGHVEFGNLTLTGFSHASTPRLTSYFFITILSFLLTSAILSCLLHFIIQKGNTGTSIIIF